MKESQVAYRIYDSLDRPCGDIAFKERDLYEDLESLRDGAEEEGDRLTYAIGKILPNGDVTFDFG